MRIAGPKALARRHEELLFQRAYPASEEEALSADRQLSQIAGQVQALQATGRDLTPLEEYDTSGIAGSGITAVFSYGVARHLLKAHGDAVDIEWDAYDCQEPLGRLLPQLLPISAEDALVEAHVPYRDWVHAAAGTRSDLAWLIEAIEARWRGARQRAERYDALQIPLRWSFGVSTATRTLMRLPGKELFVHREAYLTRRDVSLDAIPELPPLPVRKMPRALGAVMLALARDTSAVRYRELHGFTWGDPRHVYEVDGGRGLKFYFSSLLATHRLPLRACHSMSLWKNGVPVGYFEGLTLFERMEAGFNLYYTFRAGETAYLYAKVLQACHQLLGVTTFVLDPYQVGHENDEGLESGAFWFYRKLGYRSTDPAIAALTEKEEARIKKDARYRTPLETLRRLVEAPMVYELRGHETGAWDQFQLRRLGLRTAGNGAPKLPRALAKAKAAPEEIRYLQLMREDSRFRQQILDLGRP
ncbi:MAG: hypothetical protein QM757_47095 [Paludibaculum sp.]